MATRIVNKLYNCFGTLIATKNSLYNEGVYAPVNVESDLVHVEPQPKRPTKNLESLIKAANEHGYVVHLCQSTYDKSWQAYLFTDSKTLANAGSFLYGKTPYQALKMALEFVNKRWYE